MKNVVVLQKVDGDIYCQQVTKAGLEYMEQMAQDGLDNGYWEEGGTITLDELEEILDKEVE